MLERRREHRCRDHEPVDVDGRRAAVLDVNDELAGFDVEASLPQLGGDPVGDAGGGRGCRAAGEADRDGHDRRAAGEPADQTGAPHRNHRRLTSSLRPARSRGSAASCAAADSMARAAGSSGSAITTGTPASPPCRSAMLSGTLASSGTGSG